MKIVTLIENLTYQKGLVAEHGLSFYIETPRRKILFDTGQSALFMQNAGMLGISIEDIDTVILSHGHYDHTGGLYPFLEKNSIAKVYAREDIFIPKYKGPHRFIGVEKSENILRERFIPVQAFTEIDQGVFIIPDIPAVNPEDTHFLGFHVRKGNEFVADLFADELFLVLQHEGKISIVTACSHRGITNICEAAFLHFKFPLKLVTGGFHLKDCSPGQFKNVISYFQKINPESIGVCHCTGVDRYARMIDECKTQVFYNFTGTEIIL